MWDDAYHVGLLGTSLILKETVYNRSNPHLRRQNLLQSWKPQSSPGVSTASRAHRHSSCGPGHDDSLRHTPLTSNLAWFTKALHVPFLRCVSPHFQGRKAGDLRERLSAPLGATGASPPSAISWQESSLYQRQLWPRRRSTSRRARSQAVKNAKVELTAGIFDGPRNKQLSGRTVVLIFLLIFSHLHNIVLCRKSQSIPIYGIEAKNHRNIAWAEILK